MANFTELGVAYLLGGLTFLPLVLVSIFAYSFAFLPRSVHGTQPTQPLLEPHEDELGDLKEKLQDRNHEADGAASYFAVCREYVPGGLNGKPPERTTPAGETIAAESPSVYQSMYRSIFDRNKTQVPSIEGGKPVKKARNVFYVVLRHGHLLLFDNSEQVEVRHVIALAHYNLDIYAGGEDIPEGELYIKRNCIRLTKRRTPAEEILQSMPFYLFSENCSEKEDFYHALLHNQGALADSSKPNPVSQIFETEDMIKLVRALHVSDEHLHTRWLNALVGRLFLALYKTNESERFLRTKIEKKIARVSKPAFITSLKLQDVDLGTSAPTVTNPKLREMNVDGGLTLEADIRYSGSFKVVVSAVARLELGSRFKPRSVDLVLAAIIKRLDGHLLVRIKPPPSNRIWITFETMPKLELSVEPVVSSRQITYGLILRAIESRVREVFCETLVSPNWDDIPFFDTAAQPIRGGIWEEEATSTFPSELDTALKKALESSTDLLDVESKPTNMQPLGKTASTPQIPIVPLDAGSDGHPASSKASHPEYGAPMKPAKSPTPPKVMRSNSFASVATPIVTNEDLLMGEPIKKHSRVPQQDAASAMKELSSRSHDSSPVGTPTGMSSRHSMRHWTSASTGELLESPELLDSNEHKTKFDRATNEENSRRSIDSTSIGTSEADGHSLSSGNSPRTQSGRPTSISSTSSERKAAINQSIGSATAAAKKWGIGVLSRQTEWKKPALPPRTAPSQPYGRGQPLPPPGTPLPKPEPIGWCLPAMNSLKRKPIPGNAPQLPPRSTEPTVEIVDDRSMAQGSEPLDDGSREIEYGVEKKFLDQEDSAEDMESAETMNTEDALASFFSVEDEHDGPRHEFEEEAASAIEKQTEDNNHMANQPKLKLN